LGRSRRGAGAVAVAHVLGDEGEIEIPLGPRTLQSIHEFEKVK
jgi:hypothetical protein